MSWLLRAVGWLVRALLGLRSRVQPSVYCVRPGALLILETDREMPLEQQEQLRAVLASWGLRAQRQPCRGDLAIAGRVVHTLGSGLEDHQLVPGCVGSGASGRRGR